MVQYIYISSVCFNEPVNHSQFTEFSRCLHVSLDTSLSCMFYSSVRTVLYNENGTFTCLISHHSLKQGRQAIIKNSELSAYFSTVRNSERTHKPWHVIRTGHYGVFVRIFLLYVFIYYVKQRLDSILTGHCAVRARI